MGTAQQGHTNQHEGMKCAVLSQSSECRLRMTISITMLALHSMRFGPARRAPSTTLQGTVVTFENDSMRCPWRQFLRWRPLMRFLSKVAFVSLKTGSEIEAPEKSAPDMSVKARSSFCNFALTKEVFTKLVPVSTARAQ